MRNIVAAWTLLIAGLIGATAAPFACGVEMPPQLLIESATREVIGAIRQDPGIQAGDPKKIAALVETSILPLFDFDRMTRDAMARNWRIATVEQRAVLTEEFKTLLVRTYSAALGNYSDEEFAFRKSHAAPGETEVTVKSDVRQPGRNRMTLDYDMERTPEGWKIFDVTVAGVRLVSSYRDLFAEKVRAVGVEGLILLLSDANRQGLSRFNHVNSVFWEKSRVVYLVLRNMLGGRTDR